MAASPMESAKEAGAADAARQGVRTAILANRLETIARKMANTLFRTARSGLINTARDLSCCIVTANHELLAEAESLPSHVLIGPDIMSRTLAAHHPAPRRGDAFLHNSPYHGNSHAADHTIMVPVIDDAGVHRGATFMAAYRAAHPRRSQGVHAFAPGPYEHVIQIRVPALSDPRLQRELEDTIRQMANRIITLVTRR
jgi:Hydantoinase B/oxoprolinase